MSQLKEFQIFRIAKRVHSKQTTWIHCFANVLSPDQHINTVIFFHQTYHHFNGKSWRLDLWGYCIFYSVSIIPKRCRSDKKSAKDDSRAPREENKLKAKSLVYDARKRKSSKDLLNIAIGNIDTYFIYEDNEEEVDLWYVRLFLFLFV